MKSFHRLLVVVCAVLVWAGSLAAQTTISTGSIQGTVQDQQGAVVRDAKVTITNRGTGRALDTETNSAGAYVSGALTAGAYVVRIEAPGFRTAELQLTVQVGVTANGNVRLQVGQASQVVEVQATEIHVNTEQATVQGVLTAQQIDDLPINGRNFLDLAQLEPGVQIQDGGNFDPTKNGFSSISFGGRFGRTARIEVDGIDISDETVGTTTQNIPKEAIQEFQIGQSMLDLSTELTSSGAVNVVTRSGTNQVHGDLFGAFRDASLAAHLPGETKSSFQRQQYGGRFGGPLVRDRMFFFISGERTKQALQAPVLPNQPFDTLFGNFQSPFRDTQLEGRLDYELGKSGHLFYRFSYEQNRNVANYTPNAFQPFANNNHTPVHAVGYDFTTGVYNHSIRFGYTKFRNAVTDAVTGTSIFNPAPQLELAIGGDPFCLTAGADDFCSGPNFLAPQTTFQTNKQFKYDGSRTWRNHIIRYGGGYNRVQGGGYAKFLGTAPAVSSVTDPCYPDPTCAADPANGPFPGGASNPLNYPAQQVILGNGQGFSSEMPAFGFPAGGLGPDNRLSWYAGDSYKFKPNLTITAGVRYVRDTGRTDSDLAPIPCSKLTADAQAYLTDPAINNPCSGNILDLWGAGLGNRVKQQNANFAPQVGIVWDPSKNGKTVIRAGWGVFYENSVWNNNLYDRPPRLAQGLFLAQTSICTNGTASDPTYDAICNHPIGSVAADIAAAQAQYQAETAANGAAANEGFIGNTLSSVYANGTAMFAPNYISPRSIQFNLGLQQEIRPGMVFTFDYLRNMETHTLLLIDVNHVGEAGSFDKAAAQAAIQQTLQDCGAPDVDHAISSGACPSGDPNDPRTHPATIVDFAQRGLDSADVFCSGAPCGLVNGVTGPRAAFPGRNKFLGANQMLFPVGRSTYRAWQMSLKQNAKNPFRHVKAMNMQVSYSLSRYEATAQDSDFVNYAENMNSATAYQGPNGLDRRHQISFGGTMELPLATRLSFLSHFYSPLPQSLRLPTSGNAGGIFVTDVDGDGTGDGSAVSNGGLGDLVPGTKLGAFGRTTSASGINALITNYNNNHAGTVTPAGQVLLNNGLFTQTQLALLGAVQQPLQLAPDGQVGLAWMKALDVSASWGFKVRERVRIEPSVSFFNVFNFANFDSPNNPLSGILDGSAGSANGTTSATRATGNTRIGLGTGVFAQGAPRVMEFGLRVSF